MKNGNRKNYLKNYGGPFLLSFITLFKVLLKLMCFDFFVFISSIFFLLRM
jgi:hypothetical protein